MILKFNCPECGNDIVTQHLNKGDPAKCKRCGASTKVPLHAAEGTSKDVEAYFASLGQIPPPISGLDEKAKPEKEPEDERIPPEQIDHWGRRIIGIILIGGGIMGFGVSIFSLFSGIAFGPLIFIFPVILFYIFSFIAGLTLITDSPGSRPKAMIILLIQIPFLACSAITYKFISGFFLGPVIRIGEVWSQFGVEFYFYSSFYFGRRVPGTGFEVGLNLYALAAIIFLKRMESKLSKNEINIDEVTQPS